MTIDDTLRAVREIVRRNLDAGTPELISREVREFARKNGTTLSEVRILQKQVEKEGLDDFLRDRVAAKEVRNIESVSEWYTNELISVVNRGIAQGWDEDVIKRRVESVLQQSERRVKTALETIRRAASIQAVYEKATEAFNDPWMRYTGPSGANSRAFCRNYLGVVKRASEWAQIQNGQTGAVLPWVGGYNCRHRLVVASRESEMERFTSKGFKVFAGSSDFGFWGVNKKYKADDGYEDAKFVAQYFASVDRVAMLDGTRLNRRGGIVDLHEPYTGTDFEIKRLESGSEPSAKRVESLIRKKKPMEQRQSDNYIVVLDQPIIEQERERLLGKIRKWASAKVKITIYIMEAYKMPFSFYEVKI